MPPGDVPYYIHWEISGRVIAYALTVSALTDLVFGLAPAGRAARRHAGDDRVLVGIAGAFGVTRVIASLLYNVTVTDPFSFGGGAIFLTAIAFVASYLPARRATVVDPDRRVKK